MKIIEISTFSEFSRIFCQNFYALEPRHCKVFLLFCRLLMRLPAPSDHCYCYFYCYVCRLGLPCLVAVCKAWQPGRAGRVCPGFLRPIQSLGTALEKQLPETPRAATLVNSNAPVKTLFFNSA